MALKIRLRQQGCKNRAFYRMVVTDVRNPRDGKYVEALGWYNPVEAELDKSLFIKTDRIQHWLDLGAELTENARTLVSKVAPDIVRGMQEKTAAKRAKLIAKRKQRKAA